MVADTVESLRPKLNLYSSLEEAVRAVEELNKEYQMKIGVLCYYYRTSFLVAHVLASLSKLLYISPFRFKFIFIVYVK